MTAVLIRFPEPPKGNGSLEIVRDYFDRIHPARVISRSLVDQAEADAALPDADYFLVWLASHGFIIQPANQ